MKKTILLILIILSILGVSLHFWGSALFALITTPNKAGIRVLSTPADALVFIDQTQVGKTPFQDENLQQREYTIKITSGDLIWQGKVRLNAGTLTVINRELSKDTTSASGETLTLEKGQGATIISFPADADVEIDGKFYGKTPLSIKAGVGEHTININHSGYLKRSIKAYVPENYNLNLSVDLAISEADLATITTPPITETPKLKVLDTPTGFLRIRDKPDLGGKELARVTPGDEIILLEELHGWDRVRLPDGTEGYVSKDYVEKKKSL